MTTTKKILIVDDVEDLRSEIVCLLEDEGYIALQADNGETALNVISTNAVDLVISDILMPVMDGLELSQTIIAQYPDIKIILISGGGREILQTESYDYLKSAQQLTGVAHVLKKPFSDEDLLAMIHKALSS